MTTKPQPGGSFFAQQVQSIRNANKGIRRSLSEILNGSGPQTTANLCAKAALDLNVINEAIGEIEQIGRNVKEKRKGDGGRS